MPRNSFDFWLNNLHNSRRTSETPKMLSIPWTCTLRKSLSQSKYQRLGPHSAHSPVAGCSLPAAQVKSAPGGSRFLATAEHSPQSSLCRLHHAWGSSSACRPGHDEAQRPRRPPRMDPAGGGLLRAGGRRRHLTAWTSASCHDAR